MDRQQIFTSNETLLKSKDSRRFLFVGNRLHVLYALLERCANVAICLESQSFAAKTLQRDYHEFHSKHELLTLLQTLDFDILVSNGCPYILPISQIAKPHHIFVNCHPSLLPNLKGKHPINGAILYHQASGATCHLMTDRVDSGAIISQVPVYNDENTPLALLYQMCFLAEKEAFLLALEKNFQTIDSMNCTPLESKLAEIPYFTRSRKDLLLDFGSDSTQTILNKVKAFSVNNQMVSLHIHEHILKITHAMLIDNPFLQRMFQDYQVNDIVLAYENHLLCKRAEGFLQLTTKEELPSLQLPINLNPIHNNFNAYTAREQTCNKDSCKSHEDSLKTLTNKASLESFNQIDSVPNEISMFCQDSLLESTISCEVDYPLDSTHSVQKQSRAAAPFCIFSSKSYVTSMLRDKERRFTFHYTEGDKLFSNTAIMQPIPNTTYVDMSSPYGYGGYFTNSNDSKFLSRAITSQSIQAKKHGVVAEFIRFHPHYPHNVFFRDVLDFFCMQKAVIEVSTKSALRWQNYSSRLRGKLRKSLEMLHITQSYDTQMFYTLYNNAMQQKQANPFYFFDYSYFQNLISMPECVMLEARYKNVVCAMGIFLFDSLCGYYHLGANAPLTLNKNLNAMSALFERFFEIANARGLQYCLLGGGQTLNNEDSLFAFKKQFATNIKRFCIGGKIYNTAIYQALCANTPHFQNVFPLYRFALQNPANTGGGGQSL
ncbi:hypothetical protein CQA66_07835 [Helicobacter aurati]|uniref:Formyl transferase N-terminal domain-containing protein n=2 Tax=Helicobacter aurati TaxID=137778 RepID=A0A3D8J0D3_9HELI|nr:formyltransferase family protein [Helicobacter aurati]RDU70615.1 hypothetical protein CQA66_07835 [Helicobacter aurati]